MGPGVRALEIGCGTGLFTEMFKETGADLLAVDISGELLERARARHIANNRVRFIEGRFEDSAVGGPFDAVIGSSVLHHLDVRVALARIHGLLTPGGRLCLAEPNMLNPPSVLGAPVSRMASLRLAGRDRFRALAVAETPGCVRIHADLYYPLRLASPSDAPPPDPIRPAAEPLA